MLSPDARRYVIAGLVLVGVAFAGAAVFVTSGIYNVSAAREHLDLTTWILDLSRRSSVRTHSLGVQTPPLDEPGMVELGARYFEYGCAPCHGAPDRPPSPIAHAMLPDPPDLGLFASDWSTEELFWIVHNGQKYTGMPAWPDFEREDEVWPVVAFLEALPQLDGPQYQALAVPGAMVDTAFLDAPAEELRALCIGCHGDADGRPINPRVPRLGGQTAVYLERSLHEYANDRRESGMMELFARNLSEGQIADLAAYYAAGAPDFTPAQPAIGDPIAGSDIFSLGVPERDVPACIICHVVSQNPDYPRLNGQSAHYIRQQLENWHEGLRDNDALGQIMAPVAARLTARQRTDVAAYVETLPPFAGGGP